MEARLLHIQTCAENSLEWKVVGHIPLSTIHTQTQQDCSKPTYAEGVLNLLTSLLAERGVYSGWKLHAVGPTLKHRNGVIAATVVIVREKAPVGQHNNNGWVKLCDEYPNGMFPG